MKFLDTTWPPRDWRAYIALVGSMLGAATLTAVAAWVIYILWLGGWPIETASQRISALAQALLGLLAIIGIILMSLGLAINRRSVKASGLGFSLDATGGDDPAGQAADKVAGAAVDAAQEVKGETA